MEIKGNGCNGNCCEKFNLCVSIEEIDEMILKISKQEDFIDKELEIENLTYIKDMLIPLGEVEICPQTEVSIKSEEFSLLDNRSKQFWKLKDNKVVTKIYTCKHFNKETRLCNNYESRPSLCRKFGENCSYKGCGFKEMYWSKIYEDIDKFRELNSNTQNLLENKTFTNKEEI